MNDVVSTMPEVMKARYQWMKRHCAPDEHPGFGLEIIASDRRALIADITSTISNLKCSLEYTHSWMEHDGLIHILIQLATEKEKEEMIRQIKALASIHSVKESPSLFSTYGKRIIVMGGGAQVAQVASGAIGEADRHNIRGEKISIDTVAVIGEERLSEAITAVGTLDRVAMIVLAGSLMGGEITRSVHHIRHHYGIPVVALKMAGSVTREADLIVGDPTEAGVMSVMLISHIGQFNLEKVHRRTF